MNKKLPRLLRPNVRLYMILLIAFALTTFFLGGDNDHRLVAGVQVLVVIALAIYTRIVSGKRTEKLLNYLESISDSMDLTVRDTPLPAVILNTETGEILWSNDRFIAISDLKEPFFELNITDVVPEFTWDWLLDGKSECQAPIPIGGKRYWVYGSLVRSERDYVAMTYWVDVTEYHRVADEYLDSRLVFAIIMLDNYDELLKGMREKEKTIILSDIDDKITAWTGDFGGYLCRYERDRYFFLFEDRHLERFVKDKFSILEEVHANTGADGVHATLSIGLGKDGDSPVENYRNASLAIEMALTRGGDQAVIKNRYGFEFYGGHSPKLEKRRKVKSRVLASAFGEMLSDASKVFVMGHKAGDFDSVGAAVGVCCLARAKKKQAHIVIDIPTNNAQDAIALVSSLPEYEGVFITEEEALLDADSKTLLVVVDTSRPEQVESESLLMSCTRIAVVDHHRRAATYIENAVFNFHEPHASSTSELVTEMIQYLLDPDDILRIEAELLLAGIVLDTKGFAINTGSGTFDAASFLQRAGADAAAVKRLLQSDIETATARYALIREASIYREGIAIAFCDENQNRISIAQASDELLNVRGVHTSFVVARDGAVVYASGRSIGKVNVQLILEKLGGGGSQSTAGLQVKDTTVAQVVENLKRAIDDYLDRG
ncbi:MAG: DHH family phosphoesterase [Oscillospiraceae bacterium]|nr:DHH family phosphoesterase [Oscillospiraceae bacterium]